MDRENSLPNLNGSGVVWGISDKKDDIYYENVLIGSVELRLNKGLYLQALRARLLWSGMGVFTLLLVLIVVTRPFDQRVPAKTSSGVKRYRPILCYWGVRNNRREDAL